SLKKITVIFLIVLSVTSVIIVLIRILSRVFFLQESGTLRSEREYPLSNLTQTRRPPSIADALEDMINSNNVSEPENDTTIDSSNNNNNTLDISSNSGYRVIRTDDEKNGKTDEKTVTENTEVKRVIR